MSLSLALRVLLGFLFKAGLARLAVLNLNFVGQDDANVAGALEDAAAASPP